MEKVKDGFRKLSRFLAAVSWNHIVIFFLALILLEKCRFDLKAARAHFILFPGEILIKAYGYLFGGLLIFGGILIALSIAGIFVKTQSSKTGIIIGILSFSFPFVINLYQCLFTVDILGVLLMIITLIVLFKLLKIPLISLFILGVLLYLSEKSILLTVLFSITGYILVKNIKGIVKDIYYASVNYSVQFDDMNRIVIKPKNRFIFF